MGLQSRLPGVESRDGDRRRRWSRLAKRRQSGDWQCTNWQSITHHLLRCFTTFFVPNMSKTYVMKENKTNDIAPYFSHQSKFVWKHSVSPRKLFIFIWFICLRFVHKINRTAKWLLPAQTDCGGVSLFKPLPFHSFFHRAILHSKVLKTTRCQSTVFVAAGRYAGSFTTGYHLVGQHWIVLPVTAFCSQK